MRSLEILLVEPWFGGSHRAWAEGWQAHSRHRIRIAGLPPERLRWRLRGSAVALADLVAEAAGTGPIDAVVVSGLTDVSAFCGMIRATLGGAPVLLYLHETQLAQPTPDGRHEVEDAARDWSGICAADAVACNSVYHRECIRTGVERLLAAVADDAHDRRRHLLDEISVIPLGVDLDWARAGHVERDGPPLVLWNHRWNEDKRPGRFFRALEALLEEHLDFEVAVAGENDMPDPIAVRRGVAALGDRVRHVGYLPTPAYRELLLQSDIVVSTADHELFGVAAVEATAAGAVPLLPDRLSYPEIVPRRFHPAVLYDFGELQERLRKTVSDLSAARSEVDGLAEAMQAHSWPRRVAEHDRWICEVVEGLART